MCHASPHSLCQENCQPYCCGTWREMLGNTCWWLTITPALTRFTAIRLLITDVTMVNTPWNGLMRLLLVAFPFLYTEKLWLYKTTGLLILQSCVIMNMPYGSIQDFRVSSIFKCFWKKYFLPNNIYIYLWCIAEFSVSFSIKPHNLLWPVSHYPSKIIQIC